MIVIAGKNDIAVHGLLLAIKHFDTKKIIVVVNRNDAGIDGWQRSLLKLAIEKNIQVKTLSEVYEDKVEYFISLEFDQIVKPEKLSTDKVYNIHFSKLPEYKGMYTSVWPILFFDKESGVTLHKIDPGIDTGDVIAQRTFELTEEDRSQDCYRKYIESSKSLLSECFTKILENNINPVRQSGEKSTYFSAKSIDYSNLEINFKQTAWQIKRQVYAYSFRPYQLMTFNNRNVSDVVITESKSYLKPGKIVKENLEYVTLATVDYDIDIYFDALDFVLKSISNISVEEYSRAIVKTLGVNDKNEKGWSAIIVAAYYGRKDLIEYLLENGANINDTNYRGTTVLMYAKDFTLRENDSDFFNFILQQGADVGLEDWSGKTLLDYITPAQANLLGLTN